MAKNHEPKSTYILGREYVNGAGWPAFSFVETPYVHKSNHGAENEARKLARKYKSDIAIFKKIATVSVEQDDTPAPVVSIDELAGALARAMQESDRHMSMESCRYIVDKALKNIQQENTNAAES